MVIGDRHAPESESPVVGRLLFKPALRVETIPFMTPPPFRLSRSATIRLLLLLIAGGLFTGWMVVRADRALRADLLQHTRAVAQAVNLDQVRALSGTAADLELPAYLRLKEQFITIRTTLPHCRFLYLLGRKPDGTVFIFGDSEFPSSKDYSPPG